MKRWNDKLRPMDMYEVDKQAHKMIVAWLLLVINSREKTEEERLELARQVVEGGIFDYFYRLVITDIKPPVFYKIKEDKEHYRALSNWVLGELDPMLSSLPDGVKERFEAWLDKKIEERSDDLSGRILDAAHTYASSWEFGIIKAFNSFDEEIPLIDASFSEKQAVFSDLPGAKELQAKEPQGEHPHAALGKFAALCGQLRFQARWSQTPRVPETSVMGHMFMVACYAYFYSLSIGACRARALNNFFAGLFHDLPELLTRDIISPVKKSFKELDQLLQEYERQQMESCVFAPLRENNHKDIVERLAYYLGLETGSEFHSSIIEGGKIRRVGFDELHEHCNQDGLDPKDGELLKMCDELAAFLEAYTSIRNGVASPELEEAMWRLKSRRSEDTRLARDMRAILADFD